MIRDICTNNNSFFRFLPEKNFEEVGLKFKFVLPIFTQGLTKNVLYTPKKNSYYTRAAPKTI